MLDESALHALSFVSTRTFDITKDITGDEMWVLLVHGVERDAPGDVKATVYRLLTACVRDQQEQVFGKVAEDADAAAADDADGLLRRLDGRALECVLRSIANSGSVKATDEELSHALVLVAALCYRNAAQRDLLTAPGRARVYEQLAALACDRTRAVDLRMKAAIALNNAIFKCPAAERQLPDHAVANLSAALSADRDVERELRHRLACALGAARWHSPLTADETMRDDFSIVLRSLSSQVTTSAMIFERQIKRVLDTLGYDERDGVALGSVDSLDELRRAVHQHFALAIDNVDAWSSATRALQLALLEYVEVKCGPGPWPCDPCSGRYSADVETMYRAVEMMRDAVRAHCSHRVVPEFFIRLHGLPLDLASDSAAVCVASEMCVLGVLPEFAMHWCDLTLHCEAGSEEKRELSVCDPARTFRLIYECACLEAADGEASPFQRVVEKRAGFVDEDDDRRCKDVLLPVLRVMSGDAGVLAIEAHRRAQAQAVRSAALIERAMQHHGKLVHTSDGDGRRTGVIVVDWSRNDGGLMSAVECGKRFLLGGTTAAAGWDVFWHATTGGIGELYGGVNGREFIFNLPNDIRRFGGFVPFDFGAGLYFSPPSELAVALRHLVSKRAQPAPRESEFAAAMLLMRLPVDSSSAAASSAPSPAPLLSSPLLTSSSSSSTTQHDDRDDSDDDDDSIHIDGAVNAFDRTQHTLRREREVCERELDFSLACLCTERETCVHVAGGEYAARVHDLAEHALPDVREVEDGWPFNMWQDVVQGCRNGEQAVFAGNAAWVFGPQAIPDEPVRKRVHDTRVVHQLMAQTAGRRGAATCDYVVVLECARQLE